MLEQFTQELIQWIRVLPLESIYLVFFLVAYFENIIPPIPGDLLVAFGGYLVAETVIAFTPLLLLTTVASVIGFMSLYWLGSHWNEQMERHGKNFWMVRFISLEYIEKAQRWMGRWGQGVILANRFLVVTRSVISLAAGMSRTQISRTVISSFVSSILWNGILLGFGWFVHNNWKIIGHYLSVYGRIIIGLIAFVVAIRIGIHYYRKKTRLS
jgi:membrane protein DedA with SNARE-associated domain